MAEEKSPFIFEPLPMREAVKFWEDKVKLPPGEYRDLAIDAKVRAFGVSGIAKGRELETVFSSLRRALVEGISFGEFRKECREIFRRRGWYGKGAWRVDNIFRTNVQTAYHVGRYKQLAGAAKDRPYWMYDAVNDSRTRPLHAALDGKVFPADSSFWDSWYPPNGYRCRCGVVSLTGSQVKDRGLDVSEDINGKLIEPVDPKTGMKLLARLLVPDEGFSGNPGRSVWGALVDGALKEGVRLEPFPGLKGASDYRLPAAQNMKKLPGAPELLPSLDELKSRGMSNREAARFYEEEFRKAFGIEKGGEKLFNVHGEPVIVSERMVTGKGGRVKITKGDRGQYVPLFKKTVTDPDEVWITPMADDAGKVVLRRRHLSFWRGEDENIAGFCVLDIDGGVWNGISVYDVQAGQTGFDGASLLDGENGYRRGILLKKR